jgi:hypothetical protein
MTAQAKGCILIAVILVVQSVGCVMLVPVQALPSARVGIAGSFDGPLEKPVKMTATLPKSYGLTSAERVAGLPPLNQPRMQEAVLGTDFTLVVSEKQLYCTTHFWWQRDPPPPALFVLRFSDADDETYLIYGPGASEYLVRSSGSKVPHELATYQLQIGGFERTGSYPYLWLLRLQVRRSDRSG